MDPSATPVEPARLSDHELTMLESTLRVQLEVGKLLRVAQITGAVGAAVLSGGLSAVPSGYTIITSQVQRRKCKQRYREIVGEMLERGLPHVVGDAKPLGKRAYALSMATGCVCCVLSFAADLLIDRAVLQVVSEVVLNFMNEFVMGSLQTFMTARVATLRALASTSAMSQQDDHHPQLKSTRSWAGFKSQWKWRKSKQAPAKAESLPPDLFGEQKLTEQGLAVVEQDSVPQCVEVHRSSEFGAYGECLVLRFSTIIPADDSTSDVPPHRQYGRMTIVGEDEALPESLWSSLWQFEDGPTDVDKLSYDGDYRDLFGGSGSDHAGRSTDSSDDEDDTIDMVGVPLNDADVHGAYDLFGYSIPTTRQRIANRVQL